MKIRFFKPLILMMVWIAASACDPSPEGIPSDQTGVAAPSVLQNQNSSSSALPSSATASEIPTNPSPAPTPTPALTPTDTSQTTPSPAPSQPTIPEPTPTPTNPAPAPSPQPPAGPQSPFKSPLPVPPSAVSDPYMDEVVSYSHPSATGGFGAEQLPSVVLGTPRGNGNFMGSLHVVSLGFGGEITLKSATPILNGPGKDFIVFENAFGTYFEPAQVWVSQDGIDFVPFPCAWNDAANAYPGCAGTAPVYANPNTNSISPTDPNAAGGNAYDLEDLNIDWVSYIKIIDHTPTDIFCRADACGFDLDAISIIHQ